MVFPCVLNRCRRDVDADYSCCHALVAQKSNAIPRAAGAIEHLPSLHAFGGKTITVQMKLTTLFIEDLDGLALELIEAK